jgi:hypothetical protein
VGSGSLAEQSLVMATWSSHFDMLKSCPDFDTMFSLYLKYNIFICQVWATRSQDFNPGDWQAHMWDGIWHASVDAQMDSLQPRPFLGGKLFHGSAALLDSDKSVSGKSSFVKMCSCCLGCGSPIHHWKLSAPHLTTWLVRSVDDKLKGPGEISIYFSFNGVARCSHVSCKFEYIFFLCGSRSH